MKPIAPPLLAAPLLAGLLLAALLLAALLLTARPARADEPCPPPLARLIEAHAPACRLLREGALAAAFGNAGVVYRLYRWVSTLEDEPGGRHDAPPYNQVGVTLRLARQAEDEAFWAGHHWLGQGWFEAPRLVVTARYGEMLVVPGRYAGTGGFVDDRVFMPTMARTWMEIDAVQLDQESGQGWARLLQAHLPEGARIAKGIALDYETLRAVQDR